MGDLIRLSISPALTGTQLSREVYASHQVLLITSFWETGPIVAWEAMAAGRRAAVRDRHPGLIESLIKSPILA